MFDNAIYKNEYINLFQKDDKFYISVLRTGYTLDELNKVLLTFPRVKLTEFKTLIDTLNSLSKEPVLLGELKPLIELTISADHMIGQALINMRTELFNEIDKTEILKELLVEIQNSEIIYGYTPDSILESLAPNEPFIIANGTLPITGNDAIITYYDLGENKPEILSDNSTNHYELNLIHKVEKGDWLGERIEPTEGIPGKTILGENIPAQKGKQEKLQYDRKTIREHFNPDKQTTTLYALRKGAVSYENNIITVSNYMSIDGNVDYSTGNVDFDGFLDVKQSIEDHFSVRADYDIQILGDLGVGAIDEIESREGNIYIKGGISGKSKAKIICKGNLFTKFAAECEIICSGSVNIGFYAINANITAKEIIFDSSNSKIVGGHICAESKIKVATLGSKVETPTYITINGFNRREIKKSFDNTNETISKVKQALNLVKQKLYIYELSNKSNDMDPEKEKTLLALHEKSDLLQNTLSSLTKDLENYTLCLRSKGQGELEVTKELYPKVHIKLQSQQFINNNVIKAPCNYYIDKNKIIKE